MFNLKKYFLSCLILLAFLITSCVTPQNPQIAQIPNPKVKSEIKVSLSSISNISKEKITYEVFTTSNFILNLATNYDIREAYDETEEPQTNTPQTEETNVSINEETNVSTNTNTIKTQETPQRELKIDLDTLIQETIKKNFKTFVKSLGEFNPKQEEITILNTNEIEKALVNNIIASKSKLTNYIYSTYETNYSYITNYSLTNEILPDGTTNQKVVIEIVETAIEIENKRISNEILMKFIFTNTPWVLRITNGIPFKEGTPSDIELSVFYEISQKPEGKYMTNYIITLYNLASNKITKDVYLYKTNLLLDDLLKSDYRIFDELRPLFYSHRCGKLVVEVEPDDYNIYVDNFLIGKGKAILKYIMEGRHKISFGKWNYKLDEWVEVEPYKVNFYKKSLLSISSNSGILKISSIPQEALTFVESEYYGKTPVTLELPQGQYRCRLQKGGLVNFSILEVVSGKTNEYELKLINLKNETPYKIMVGVTTLLGITSVSSIFLYFWADSQERYYSLLAQQDPSYRDIRDYYYYFRDNMRTTAITASILTFVSWGVTLGIESDKFFMKTFIRF